MDKELAKAAGMFLMRADLKGHEVQVWGKVMQALEAIALAEPILPMPEKQDDVPAAG